MEDILRELKGINRRLSNLEIQSNKQDVINQRVFTLESKVQENSEHLNKRFPNLEERLDITRKAVEWSQSKHKGRLENDLYDTSLPCTSSDNAKYDVSLRDLHKGTLEGKYSDSPYEPRVNISYFWMK